MFGIPQQKVLEIFGKSTFLEKFGRRVWDGATTDLHVSPFADELKDWDMGIYMGRGGQCQRLICCPEDRKCNPNDHVRGEDELCKKCEVPLCSVCAGALFHADGPQHPNISLTNDMWLGFGSAYVYEVNVTYLEMLAASACCISLICFVLQAEREEEEADGGAPKKQKPVYRNVFCEKAIVHPYPRQYGLSK